jgi:hypothetical protein
MRLYLFLTLLSFQSFYLHAQRDVAFKDKVFQVSLVPALGTNGLHPGSFNNYFSLNLSSGYSASTVFFELGIISNLNTNRTNGVQLGGIANITGANAFGGLTKKQREEKRKSGFSSNLTGVQFSGVTNIVLGNAFGAQVTGGVNLDNGALIGLQISGIANIVTTYSFGVQLSGLFNVSEMSFSGVQLAGLSNYTRGELEGVQLGLVNQAGATEGKNSVDNTQPTGVQIGFINFAKKMNGFQVGVINFARQSQGTQIGLLNFYTGGKQTGTRDGTAIGLLNIGDITYASVYSSELFALNYELSTGTRKNGRIKLDKRTVYLTNTLIFSHRSFNQADWGFGYGIKKMFFNRSDVPGMSESKFWGYGIDVQHINSEKGKLTKELSLLSRIKIMAGTRIVPKLFGVNCFVALSLNTFLSETEKTIKPIVSSATTEVKKMNLQYWPGVSVGLLFH